MASCGAQATDGLVAELVRQDQELLLTNARLYDDVIPFLRRPRDRGIKIAIVSNCTENTRALLVATGVDALADALVLSCEVRSAKPAAEIFRYALDRLGVSRGGCRVRGRPAGLLRGQHGRGHPRGADRPRRAWTGRFPRREPRWSGRCRRSRRCSASSRTPRPRLGRMDTGVAIFPTHDAIPPADLARLAEERGHESLFFPEHTHIPASRQTPSPERA